MVKRKQANNHNLFLANIVLVQHAEHACAYVAVCVRVWQLSDGENTLFDAFGTHVDKTNDHAQIAALAELIRPAVKDGHDVFAGKLICNLCTFSPAQALSNLLFVFNRGVEHTSRQRLFGRHMDCVA